MADDKWRARSLSRFPTRKITWLFRPFIPYGTITTIAGDGEVGKSTALYDLVARITTGDAMPRIGDETEQISKRGSVIILCKEDDPGITIRPRLHAAGANMDRIHLIATRSRDQDDFEVLGRLDTTINSLTDAILEIGDVRAILIDPITDFAGQLDLYREDQVRRLLGPLSQLAAKHNFSVINVLHLVKDTKRKARHRILGSVGLVNISRSVLLVGKIGDRRYLLMEKANWWPEKKGVAFTLRTVDHQPVVNWETEYEDVDIEEVLTGKSQHVTKQQQAGHELRKMLAEGSMRSTDVQERADVLEISFNTFKAAKRDIGVKAVRRGGVWWWQLPEGP